MGLNQYFTVEKKSSTFISEVDLIDGDLLMHSFFSILRNHLFRTLYAVLFFEHFHQRIIDRGIHGRENALFRNRAIEHHLHCHRTRHAHQPSHGRIALGIAVIHQRRSARFPGAVGMLDFETMLQHHHVALARRILHFLLERGAESVEWGAARGDRLVGEEAQPADAGEDTLFFGSVVELGAGGDGPGEVSVLVSAVS